MMKRSVCASISLTVGTTMDDEALIKHILDVLLIPAAIEAPEILHVQKVEVDGIKPVIPVVGFTVTETIELGNYGSPGMNPEAIKQLDVKDPSKLFNEPLTIPVEDEKGNVHIFEGCYVKSVEHNYPVDGPLVEEPHTVFYGRVGSNVVPGPEVLGQEEYDRRQNALVLEAVKAISSERLRWVLSDRSRGELALDPGVKCWMDFATAVLKHRGEL